MAEALQNQQWIIEKVDVSGGALYLLSVLAAVKNRFTFLSGRVSALTYSVREALLGCTLLCVWMVELTLSFKKVTKPVVWKKHG